MNSFELMKRRWRVPLFLKSSNLVITWSEKSGCSFLTTWWAMQLGYEKELKHSGSFIHDFKAARIYNANYFAEVESALSDPDVIAYKFVRNPFERSVSQFFSLFDNNVGWQEKEVRQIQSTLYGDDWDFGFSFSQYLQAISTGSIWDRNIHIWPQIDGYDDSLSVRYFALDDVSRVLAQIEREFGLPDYSSRLSGEIHKKNTFDIDGEIPADEIGLNYPLAHRLPAHGSFRNDRTFSIVTRLYQRDLDVYNSCQNDGSTRST